MAYCHYYHKRDGVLMLDSTLDQLLKLNAKIIKQNDELGCPDKKEWSEITKLVVRVIDDVIVKQLPTIGKPETILTSKQGRPYTIYALEKQITGRDKDKGKGRYNGTGDSLITKKLSIEDPKETLLTAKNILKHPKATPRMKGAAKDYIELFEDLTLENVTEWVAECKKIQSQLPLERSVLARTLRGIARTLGKYK